MSFSRTKGPLRWLNARSDVKIVVNPSASVDQDLVHTAVLYWKEVDINLCLKVSCSLQ